MNIADKLTTIAENVSKVYDSGYSKAESDFWDGVQDYGNRVYVEGMFSYWGCEYIRPKYKVVHNGSSSYRILQMFYRNSKLKKIEKEYFDLSAYTPTTSASSGDSAYLVFAQCPELEVIEDIGLQGGGYYFTFFSNPKLHTIEVMRCVKNGQYSGVFNGCYALENITIEGEIGQSISFSACSKLTHESLMSIINALCDYSGDTSGTTYTLTLGSTNLAKLTADELNSIETKGWQYK